MKRVAVVGGGIAGLAAAYQLVQQQRDFVLYEAGGRLGGTVETVREDGFVLECGPDAWVTEKPWARELAEELGLGSELIHSRDEQRRTYLVQRGELVPMPDGMRMMVPGNRREAMDALLASPLFSPAAKRAYQAEPGRAQELKESAPPADETVHSFVARHFGEEVAANVAGPLLAGVFGGDIRTLSVRAVMPAFVKMERETGSLILALEQRAAERSAEQTAPIFTSLRRGMGSLAERIAAALPPERIRLRTPVRAIERSRTGWRVLAGPGAAEDLESVILATPAHVTRELLGPVLPGAAELLNIDGSSAIIVVLAYRREKASQITIPPGFGLLYPQQSGAENALLAATFLHQKFGSRAPQGAVLLRAFFASAAAECLSTKPDEALAQRARSELSALVGALPEADLTLVRRWPRSLPQYAVGHGERMAEFQTLLRSVDGLCCIGNAYNGVGLPDLIRDARATARAL